MLDLSAKPFDKLKTYSAYNPENVYKCTINNINDILKLIKNVPSNERILIELPNTVGLTHDIINNIPNNVEIRIIGSYTEEYSKSFKNDFMDHLREKATYSKEELDKIISKMESIEQNIDPKWNKYEKALYLYEYMKSDIVYREPVDAGDIRSTILRTRTWDTLTGLTNQLSTCNGYSHIYTELCTRQNIECVHVASKDHAWNIITIDNKNFLVDIIWDSIKNEHGINETNNFGNNPLPTIHIAKCYKEKSNNLSCIDQNWVKNASEKVSKNVPKEKIANEKIERFLKQKEMDRQRMMYLIGEKMDNNMGGKIL